MPISKLLYKRLVVTYLSIGASVLFAQNPYIQVPAINTYRYCFPIAQADIAGGKTCVITVPGDYYLVTDLVFKADADEKVIIAIKAHNVRLNLNKKSISSDAAYHHLKAIDIDPGLSNIVIQNGAINMVSGLGIILREACNSITINDLLISNCECGAIKLSGAIACIIDNVNVACCIGGHHEEPCGIYLLSCVDCVLQNIYCSSISSTTTDAIGIKYALCHGCAVKKCQVSTTCGVNGIGILFDRTHGCFLEESRVIRSRALNGSAYGIALCDCTGTIVQQCLSQSASSTTGSVYGFYIKGNMAACISSCASRNNIVEGGEGAVYGYCVRSSERCNVTQCLAFTNQADSNTTSVCAGIAFEDNACQCGVRDSRSINNTGGEAYGIKIGSPQSFARHCTVTQCYIAQNKGVVKQYGIKDFNPDCSTLLNNNIAIGHGKMFLHSPTLVDTGRMNYMVTYKAVRNSNIFLEGDASNLVNINTAGTFMNVSLEYV